MCIRDSVYSGATTATLTLTNVPGSMDQRKYRVIISTPSFVCGRDVTSNEASLSVKTATDNDGVNNANDLDDDNDGILDTEEGTSDIDNDGIPNHFDLDSDGDGCKDVIEAGLTDPDNNGIYFDSLPLEEEELTEGKLRLLSVDNPLVVPAGAVVRVQVTSADVIHNWAVPSFGVKMDAIPGRLNETWFKVDEPGIYYGMCSELCGVRHAYMPIEVHVLDESQYIAWLSKAEQEYAQFEVENENTQLVKLTN